ncbi:MAG: DUF6261 family protein [Verrucomicrobiota bacterium]
MGDKIITSWSGRLSDNDLYEETTQQLLKIVEDGGLPEGSDIHDVLADAKAWLPKLTSRLQVERGEQFTAERKTWDDRRDAIIGKILRDVRGIAQFDLDAAKMATAGDVLPVVTESLSGVAVLSYDAETAAVRRALETLRKPENLDHLTALGLDGLLTPLEEANIKVQEFVLAEDGSAAADADLPSLREIKGFLAKKVRTILVILAHYAEKDVEPHKGVMAKCYDRITSANALEKGKDTREEGENGNQ